MKKSSVSKNNAGKKQPVDKKETPAPAAKKVETTPAPAVKHIVTEQDLVNNPDLVTKGIKVGDEIEFVPLTKEQVEAAKVDAAKADADKKGKDNVKPLEPKASKELVEKMKPYLEAYPQNKVFYIASDGQVFLEGNKIDAEMHEKTLGGTITPFGN
jgi:plastocyanin